MSQGKISEKDITTRIQSLYPDAIIDIAGEDCSFEVYVITDEFSSMSRLNRQKSILSLFKNEIKTGKLHALSVKAKTADEQANANHGLVQISL